MMNTMKRKSSPLFAEEVTAPKLRSYTQRVLVPPVVPEAAPFRKTTSMKRLHNILLEPTTRKVKSTHHTKPESRGVLDLQPNSRLRRLKSENLTILEVHIRIQYWTLHFNDKKLENEYRNEHAARYLTRFKYLLVVLTLVQAALGGYAAQHTGTSVPHQAAFVVNVIGIISGIYMLWNLKAVMLNRWAYVTSVVASIAFLALPRLFTGSNGNIAFVTMSLGDNDLGFLFVNVFIVTYLSGIAFAEGTVICLGYWLTLIVVSAVSPEARLLSPLDQASLSSSTDDHSSKTTTSSEVRDSNTNLCQRATTLNQLEVIGFMLTFCWILILVMRAHESQTRKMFRLTRRLAAENINVQMEMTTINAFSRGAASVAPEGKSDHHVKELIATIIDNKEIGAMKLIGSGSFGQVFQSTWKGMEVAVKRLHSDVDEEELTRFGVELATMAKLRHPNIVMFLGFALLPPTIVMDFMPRGSLDELLHTKDTYLDTSICLRFLLDISKGMNFLHLNNPAVLHLDLKPANILIDTDWRLKLGDFGLSELRKDAVCSNSSNSINTILCESTNIPEKTINNNNDNTISLPAARAGNAFGSLQWAAPEMISGEEKARGESCDIYSMGVVFFELLTRKRPYHGLVLDAVPLQVLSGKRPDDYVDLDKCVDHSNKNVVEQWCKLMRHCWSEKPSERPSSNEIVPVVHTMIRSYFRECQGEWQDHVVFPGQVVRTGMSAARDSDGKPQAVTQAHAFTIDGSLLTIGRRIGGGTYGEVFQGEYFGTKVAVKQLFANAVPETVQEEFNRECAIMLQMRHPNLVLFMGSICEPPRLVLVTELMEGGSLHNVYKTREPLAPKQHLAMVCNLALGMARGLNYLHSMTPPIVHRDMKSPNVLLDRNFNGKIGDFGLSKIKEEGKALTSVGSPLWCAPEILRGDMFGLPCDVYSFGVVVWEALLWMEPYPGMSSVNVMQGVAFKDLRPTKPSSLPHFLSHVLDSCWRDDPDKRPSFGEIIQMLESKGKILMKDEGEDTNEEVQEEQKEERKEEEVEGGEGEGATETIETVPKSAPTSAADT